MLHGRGFKTDHHVIGLWIGFMYQYDPTLGGEHRRFLVIQFCHWRRWICQIGIKKFKPSKICYKHHDILLPLAVCPFCRTFLKTPIIKDRYIQ